MVEWHLKSDKMPTGGKRGTVVRCDKKKAWMGGTAAHTRTDSTVKTEERKTKAGRGTTSKVRATALKYANVTDPKTKKTTKLEIIAVKTNDANRLFARSNTSTRGAVIRVKVGSEEKLAKVTSRPGQHGTVSAVLTE
ncbi:MAG: 30S ribosomal protein S8e [archaeon]